MSTPISHQENWHDLCGILRKYLLTTSVPIIFGEVYNSSKAAYQLSNDSYKSFRESNWHNHTAKEAWASLFRQAITDTFMQRLLGSQSDMDSYRARSTKYLKTLNNMFGTHNGDDDMTNITISFFELLKDYICRNMPGLPAEIKEQSTDRVMTACREIYAAHRLRDDKPENLDRKFYIAFDERAYSSSLLTLIDEISANVENHPLTRHYLVVAEYIHVLFIYVYMIEFVKFFPSVKGKPRQKSPVIEHDRKNNLFVWLSQMDFTKEYNELEEQKKKSDQANNAEKN